MHGRRRLIKHLALILSLKEIWRWIQGARLIAAPQRPTPRWLIRRQDEGYDRRSHVHSLRFASQKPALIAAVRSEKDAIEAIRYAKAQRLAVGIKAGGHSYIGQSSTSGLLLDLSDFRTIVVDREKKLVHVEAGALQIDVARKLTDHDLTLPFGTCPLVGIAGYALGGGLGPMKRAWSVLSDRLVAARVINHEGEVLDCSEQKHADLFWALRGAGRGSFGVVSSLTFQAVACQRVYFYSFSWTWDKAPEVCAAWFAWLEKLPPGIGSRLELGVGADGRPLVKVYGNALLSRDELIPWLKLLPPGQQEELTEEDTFANILRWAGCEAYLKCPKRSVTDPLWPQSSFAARSRFVRQIPALDMIRSCLRAFERPPETRNFHWACLLIDAAGGAMDHMAPTDTAFVHRGSRALIQYLIYFDHTAKDTEAVCLRWLEAVFRTWTPDETEAYQNYADGSLENWRQAYYGAHTERLEAIKRKYDGGRFFGGPQLL